jgi:hypothetical protein
VINLNTTTQDHMKFQQRSTCSSTILSQERRNIDFHHSTQVEEKKSEV